MLNAIVRRGIRRYRIRYLISSLISVELVVASAMKGATFGHASSFAEQTVDHSQGDFQC